MGAVFELATVYTKKADDVLADESPFFPSALRRRSRLYTLKGDWKFFWTEWVLGYMFTAIPLVSYHPGRCAMVFSGGTVLGIVGQVHPLTAENYGMDCAVYAAELDFEAILKAKSPETLYRPLPRFPAVARDIAEVCDAGISVAELEGCILRGTSGLLKEIELFDVYTGAPIPDGKKSVAFSLKLRADDRTLTDKEADEDVRAVLALLETELGAVLR